MKKILLKLEACYDARAWAGCLLDKECKDEGITNQVEKSWDEIYQTCHRGDWLLWLFHKTMNKKSENDFILLTHAKGHCANTVRHIIEDKKKIAAIDAAIQYSGDKAFLEKVTHSSIYAMALPHDYAAYACFDATHDAFCVSYSSNFDIKTACDASQTAKKENQMLTANIVRQIIPIEKWNIEKHKP